MTKAVATAGSDVGLYTPGEETWDSLISGADEILGHELISGEAADRLIGVPFVITRMVFRPGVQRIGVMYRDDYVSCEARVAPQNVLAQRANRGRMDLDEISVDPDEHIVFNDGSTGIYRQCVKYLSMKGYISLPDNGMPEDGSKGASIYDLPMSQWAEGATEDGAINVRMFCPRGLRYSEYDSEYTPEGQLSKTRYIA